MELDHIRFRPERGLGDIARRSIRIFLLQPCQRCRIWLVDETIACARDVLAGTTDLRPHVVVVALTDLGKVVQDMLLRVTESRVRPHRGVPRPSLRLDPHVILAVLVSDLRASAGQHAVNVLSLSDGQRAASRCKPAATVLGIG